MCYLKKILSISRKDRITNKKVLNKITEKRALWKVLRQNERTGYESDTKVY